MKKITKELMMLVLSKLLKQPSVKKTLHDINDLGKVNTYPISNFEPPHDNRAYSNLTAGEGVVFVTGRFRSGSTMLWNLFRQNPDFTSFYEPLNERQWFNTELRGSYVDGTHLGVSDYWAEYENLELLTDFYNESWIRENLYLTGHSFQPNLRKFIDAIIANSVSRPVLQFNRIDFRLEWLRHNYPAAKVIHLYRNPRDQWCSFLVDKTLMNKDSVEITYKDNFYLDVWCEDLYKHFPFLHKSVTPHPYMRFYYVWKLSYLFGVEYSDLSISYENLVRSPEDTTTKIDRLLSPSTPLFDKNSTEISPKSVDRWLNYADEDWFLSKEQECEKTLNMFLNN